MATTYKILAQSAPAATTPVLLYGPVGAGLSTVVSTLAICNRGATAATYRISLRQAGEADATKQYLVYDASLPANSTASYTLGITLAATDSIYVYSSSSTLSFQAFGSEISA
jgi:hypothetical protein